MNLLLARHGETVDHLSQRFGGHGATPLTEDGRYQAGLLAHALAGEGITRIVSSDLVRAIETAEIVAKTLELGIELSPALRERSVGEFTGLTYAEARTRDANAFDALVTRRDPTARAPGGENNADLRLRLKPLLAKLTVGNVLLISHAYTLNVALQMLLDSDAGFFTDHCALHRLEITTGVRVLALNQTRHLI